MYSRQLSEPPVHIIENGKANFGTYNGVSQRIDIRGMFAPYAGIPVPAFISNLRIKGRLSFIFSTEKLEGFCEFLDFKAFGISQLTIWEKDSGKKYSYSSFLPTRRRIVPKNTRQGSCTNYKRTRHIRITWGKEHQHHSLAFNLKKNSIYPEIDGFIYSPINDQMHKDLLFVNPSPSSSRCSATWFTTMQIHGVTRINGNKIDDSNGLAAMMLNRSYVKLHSKSTAVYALGNVKGKNLVMQLKSSNLDAADSDNYNDNVLIVDGETTTLPPVYITHPFGINKNWIIQDTENMIDLTFIPESTALKHLNIIVFRTTNTAIYGTFEGTLLDKNGQKINLKNFPGIIYRSMFRL